MRELQPERLACLIASRNLGDIVICSGLLRELAAAGYAKRYLVWTRPNIACLFEDIPNCDIVCSPFPVGTGYRFGLRELGRLLKPQRRYISIKLVIQDMLIVLLFLYIPRLGQWRMPRLNSLDASI